MYPFGRMLKEVVNNRRSTKMDLMAVHVSHHICWPWDLDPWLELNNGRTLSLYDLGRIPMAMRNGMVSALKDSGWGMVVAGVSVRFRRRVRMFERLRMHSRVIGWDGRFFYLIQSLWRQQDCVNEMLARMAITDRRVGGIVNPVEFFGKIAPDIRSPELPAWVDLWVASEDARPWPPPT
jgi:acyl-CoA thioesterase FadM